MFSPQTYSGRRRELRRRLSAQSGLVVFMGNELCPMNYTDNTFPFRQDSTFLYYFGLDIPSLAAVIDLDDGSEILYGDDLTVEQIVWMGYQPRMDEKAQWCAVQATAPLKQFADTIAEARKQGRTVHFLPQYQPQNVITLAGLLKLSPAELNQQISEPLTRAVIAMRSVKTPEEVEQIQQAVQITGRMHITAMKTVRPGVTENQVVAAMEQVVTAHNSRMAFPVILTRHGEILHNLGSADTLKEGDLVINDSGAESPLHYAGDITRTLPVGGRFSPRQRDIYELVLSALHQSIGQIAPGVEFRQIHLHACRVLAQGLKDLGLMKGDPAEAAQQGAHALFFPCGLGHMMGLDVHDMEGLGESWVGYTDTVHRSDQFGLRSLRLARPLEPGFVLTVEPGIYFIPPLIEQWHAQNKYADFICYDAVRQYLDFGGIRIEDDVLVAPDGVQVLSADIPQTPVEIESLH